MTSTIASQQAFEAFQEELDQATDVIRSRFLDMRSSGLLEGSWERMKHLPGRHDQQRHAGNRVSKKHINSERSAELSDQCNAVSKECYKNAFMSLALAGKDAKYVEGYVVDNTIGFPFEHGWIETEDELLDPTLVMLDEDLASRYTYFPAHEWTHEELFDEFDAAGDAMLPITDMRSPKQQGAFKAALDHLGVELKHQPGRHNQLLHTPHMYRGRNVSIEHEGSADQFDRTLDTLGLSRSDLEQMFWLPNANVEIYADPMNDSTLSLNVLSYDKQGNVLSRADRGLWERPDGKLIASNDSLGVAEKGVGTASIMYANQIRILQDKGYHKIILEANSSIGRYAWARKGFDFSTDEEHGGEYYKTSRLSIAEKNFPYWAQRHGITEDMVGGSWPKFGSAADIANYDPGVRISGNDILNEDVKPYADMHAGKAFLLDTEPGVGFFGSWYGELVLNE